MTNRPRAIPVHGRLLIIEVGSAMTEEVAEGLFDLEEPVRDAADIVQAIRMLGSSEEVSEDNRGPIITLARLALDKLEWVAKERTRVARVGTH
jgi:hypothetical protein